MLWRFRTAVYPQILISDHAARQRAIVDLVNRELLAVWRRVDYSDAVAARDALLPVVRDLTAAYGEVAAITAADFYDDAREASGTPGKWHTRPSDPVPGEQSDALVRWALGPMFAEDPDPPAALAKLSGGIERLSRQPARETIYRAITRDPAEARYVRRPQFGACEFCLMLASRAYGKTTYTSSDAASTVVGREIRIGEEIVGRTGGTRNLGGRELGRSYHDHCGCEPVPVWSDDDIPEVNRELAEQWERVTEGRHDQRQAWKEHIAAQST